MDTSRVTRGIIQTIERAGLGWHWVVRPSPPVPGVTFKEGWTCGRRRANDRAMYAATLMYYDVRDAQIDQLRPATNEIFRSV